MCRCPKCRAELCDLDVKEYKLPGKTEEEGIAVAKVLQCWQCGWQHLEEIELPIRQERNDAA